ncbi:MAG: CoA transferase [bacterium]|nr:CoA transferase [bacterium]
MTVTALTGVRVLDLADESAAFATRILADLGADVIKVEPPGGSRTRSRAPFLDGIPGPERSFFHLYHDANKRSVVIDRASDAGEAQFRNLVCSADVLVETAAPAQRDELRLESERLRSWNPRLIHASVPAFASDGEWADWRGNDLIAGAASGLVWVSGDVRSAPLQGSARPAYAMASLAAATGVMVALSSRDRSSSCGAHFEVSLQEAACMAAIQTATPTFWSWFGRVPGRPGLSNALRCKDGGYVGVLIRPAGFELFLDWVEEAGIETTLTPEDAHYAETGAPRRGNPVSAATLELAARYGRDAFAERAGRAQIVCLPILDFPSMETHPHYQANEQFLEVEHASLGRTLGFPRSPVDAMEQDVDLGRAPLLDEHGPEIARELASLKTGSAEPQPEPPRSAEPGPRFDPLRALAGVRVVDFCWVLAGPIGTRLLASFGADVIRVESTRHADGMRFSAGPDGKPDATLGGLFNTANAGKRSLSIDLSTERGREVVRRLVAGADVVTNNYRPGALERMGFGYESLCQIRPDIILLNLPGTHKDGPWRDRPTMGNVVMAASGFNTLMGFPDERPRGIGVAYPDFTSPYLLATTVMAALRQRERTGKGQELDLSQLSATISLLGAEWMQYRATGVQPPPAANRDANYCPHGVYPTRGEDEWCAVAIEDDAAWTRLCTQMNRSELSTDPRFATHFARKANEDELDEIVRRFSEGLDRWELAARLQADGIAASPVENLRDTFERDPQLRPHYQIVRQPVAPELDIPIDRDAIRFDGVDQRLTRAPMLGEHNEAVLCDLLDMSDEEYQQLRVDGVLV